MAGPVDLLFAQAPLTDNPIDLVFGDVGGPAADTLVTVAGTLPALVAAVHIATVHDVTVAGTLPGLTGAVDALYVSNAARPTVNESVAAWQAASRIEIGIEHQHELSLPAPFGVSAWWQDAAASPTEASIHHSGGDRSLRPSVSSAFQEAQKLAAVVAHIEQQDGLRDRRLARSVRYQNGTRERTSTDMRYQDGIRDRRNWAAARWQSAVAHSFLKVASSGPAQWLNVGWQADHQQAMRPGAGISPLPGGPDPVDPCYFPPAGDEVHLLFSAPWSDSTDLIFVCENHGPDPDPEAVVVVPIKRVYVVLNESSLRRVDGDISLPTFSMSMSLDVDSWTWSFSASLPGQALADLTPSSPGEPVLVEAMVNGVAYRMQVERRSRDRSFANDGIRISGRGLSALLDSPHARVKNYANTAARTAQQLMNDVLTDNGVSIGWTVDWQAVDWSVPAGVFSHQGPYISALNAIAQAAGSYIQPHRTDQTLHVLPRYPELPWNWGDVIPDYEIPSSVATVENIEWVEKALYNRVFVSGVQAGVLGRVTRGGTDGGLVAPMVTDPLITTAAAARQRGIPVLANTGSQANVSLRMPVLAETGIIVPGKFMRYVDGATTRIGITRAVSVDVNSPETWQTIALETHVL